MPVRLRVALGTHQWPLSCSPPQIVYGILHVGADFVELADRQVVAEQPGLPAIPGNRHAAVAADDQVVGVVGIDPERVIFGVHAC